MSAAIWIKNSPLLLTRCGCAQQPCSSHRMGRCSASTASRTVSVGEAEAGAAHVLQRPLVLAPLVVGGEDRPVVELHHARIADVLVDARVRPVDRSAAVLAAPRAHPRRARALRLALARRAALADDELLLD